MQDIPKIVRARLQRPKPATAEPHPDADLLTAFAEQALAGRERDSVVDHLAHCGDCREIVALALPATEPVALASSGRVTRIGWLSWPVLRWGIVAAGILTVTSVGILQFRQRHQDKELVATSLLLRDQRAAPTAQSAPALPHASPSQAIAPPAEARTQAEMGKQVMEKKAPARALDASAAPRAQTSLGENKLAQAAGVAINGRASSGSASRRGTIAGPLARQPNLPAGTGQQVVPSASEVVEVEAATGPVATQTTGQNQIQGQLVQNERVAQESEDNSEAVGKAKPALIQTSPALAAAPVLRADPSILKGVASSRWTISPNGALQRSPDGGVTWFGVNISVNDSTSANPMHRAKTEQMAAVQAEANASAKTQAKSVAGYGAAPTTKSKGEQPTPSAIAIFRALSVSSNASEVWAGGSSGALYHTIDGGRSWTQVVPSDAGVTLTGDVVGIQFSDPLKGTVTTSTTETWTTADGGQTWHKQP
jgi:hypothetical protein